VYAPGFNQIAGILCIPLSQTAGDFVILFRATQEKEVHWAGNPISSKEGQNGQLEPRNSFKKWTEQVRGTCSPWTEAQFEAASLTRLVYGNFIRVWREKEAVLHATKMKRLLIENLAHEVRTPLNIAINYLEMAMEQSPNKKHTDMLSVAHSASTSLAYVSEFA
jgi:light-regulated signal transduction histidine kinase (bacteriophytochrome)